MSDNQGYIQSFNLEGDKKLTEFQKEGLVPKEETEVLSFLKKNPEYDGRNTVVAILDTGIDPGAAGMQVTSHGQPKLLDIIDCTGSGDVIIDSNPITASSNEITGKSGRALKLNPKWVNDDGKFYLGLKRLNELYPDSIISRVDEMNKRDQKVLNDKLVEEVHNKLASLDKNTDGEEDIKEKRGQKEELEAQVNVLNQLMAEHSKENVDMVDVVVFFDGKHHRVAVDWAMNGDLTDSKALPDYLVERDYFQLNYNQPPYELLNVSVKIYDDGKLISLVSTAGTHGTHVAGILASHHPNDTKLDGVAPGAQLISLKIGESRLGSMETQLGLSRAIAAMVQHKCDLANMSYGEATKLPNKGQFVSRIHNEVIQSSNCIFVSSAGNEGPALSTVGAPGGSSSDIIGVGAYVNHSMMKTDYSQFEFGPNMAYSWSSRGPTPDGDVGVDIYAPGGAITSVPMYILHKTQLMNGTSMSSPNLCGCLSLLVSGLKQNDIKYSPYRVYHAIRNTSKPLPTRSNADKASSAGLIQVAKSFEYLKRFKDSLDLDTKPSIAILNHPASRGIYLREKDDTLSPFFASVQIAPKFMHDRSDQFKDGLFVNKYEMDLYLSLSSSHSFIKVPEVVAYNNGARNFTIKVDPTHLEEGKVHYGEVQGWDGKDLAKGTILNIPVTVIKPLQLKTPTYQLKDFKVTPGSILRRFITVPEGATSCQMSIKAISQSSSPVRMYAHLVQLMPHERFNVYEQKSMLTFQPNVNPGLDGSGDQTEIRRFQVIGGKTIELCLAQFWANTGDQAFDIELDFHGVQLYPSSEIDRTLPLILDGSDSVHKLFIQSTLRREGAKKINVSLNKLSKSVAPTSASISPLRSLRDELPSQQKLYQLVLDYPINVSQIDTPSTVKFQYPQGIQKFLYDSFLDGFFVSVFDGYGKPVGYDEVSPRNITFPHAGDYLVKVQLNSTDVSLLESIKNTNIPQLRVIFNLPKTKEVTMTAYAQPHAPYDSTRGGPVTFVPLEKNRVMPLYLKTPQVPSGINSKPGDLLLGTINLGEQLSSSQQLKVGLIIPQKVDIADKSAEQDGKVDDLFKSDSAKFELELLKAKLQSIQKASDKKFKVEQFNLLTESVSQLKLDDGETTDDQGNDATCSKVYQLELLKAQLSEAINYTGGKDLPTYESSEIQSNLELIKQAQQIVDSSKVNQYFNLTKSEPKHKGWFNLQREVLHLSLQFQYLTSLAQYKLDPATASQLDDHRALAQCSQAALPSNHTYITTLAEIEYYTIKNQYGLALKALLGYFSKGFGYATKEKKEYTKLIELKHLLVTKLGYNSVWAKFLANQKLTSLPDSKFTVLG